MKLDEPYQVGSQTARTLTRIVHYTRNLDNFVPKVSRLLGKKN